MLIAPYPTSPRPSAYWRFKRARSVARPCRCGKPKLQPASALEIEIGQYRRQHHQDERKRIAEPPIELRHVAEVHAVDRGDQRRRQKDDGGNREDLDDGVLLDADHAERGIEQKDDLAGKKGGVIGQRDDVARGGTDAGLERLDFLPLIGGMNEKGEKPPERVGAFAGLRGDLALAPDRSQQHVEAALPRRDPTFDLEDRMGQPLDLRLYALDEIRKPVDDRFQEANQDSCPALELRLRSVASRDIDREGAWFGIAECDETLAGKNEGDRRRSGLALLGLIEQRRGHEIGAVLLIEAARRFDLLLLPARGHGERL